jgi:hypothetical protein
MPLACATMPSNIICSVNSDKDAQRICRTCVKAPTFNAKRGPMDWRPQTQPYSITIHRTPSITLRRILSMTHSSIELIRTLKVTLSSTLNVTQHKPGHHCKQNHKRNPKPNHRHNTTHNAEQNPTDNPERHCPQHKYDENKCAHSNI